MRVEIVVCKVINDKVWYMLLLLLTHCKELSVKEFVSFLKWYQ